MRNIKSVSVRNEILVGLSTAELSAYTCPFSALHQMIYFPWQKYPKIDSKCWTIVNWK